MPNHPSATARFIRWNLQEEDFLTLSEALNARYCHDFGGADRGAVLGFGNYFGDLVVFNVGPQLYVVGLNATCDMSPVETEGRLLSDIIADIRGSLWGES